MLTRRQDYEINNGGFGQGNLKAISVGVDEAGGDLDDETFANTQEFVACVEKWLDGFAAVRVKIETHLGAHLAEDPNNKSLQDLNRRYINVLDEVPIWPTDRFDNFEEGEMLQRASMNAHRTPDVSTEATTSKSIAQILNELNEYSIEKTYTHKKKKLCRRLSGMKGDESMKSLEAATGHSDDGDAGDLGACTPIAPRVESNSDVPVSQATDNICTPSVQVNMGNFNELVGIEVQDDVRRDSTVENMDLGLRDASDAPSTLDQGRDDLQQGVLSSKNDTSPIVQEGGRCELLGNESSQLVVSPSSGLEILPCVLCALYAPSRGPPAGLPSLIASPSVGPMVRWTKSLIAAKVAELERTCWTIRDAVSMGARSR
ncbi:hypothetical protein HanRHA438_Chr16g0754391 [Helianthus annuus]|nr:hypothetical protein HanRHA438_Chr16g0754391 [Helianthus annuus]